MHMLMAPTTHEKVTRIRQYPAAYAAPASSQRETSRVGVRQQEQGASGRPHGKCWHEAEDKQALQAAGCRRGKGSWQEVDGPRSYVPVWKPAR